MRVVFTSLHDSIEWVFVVILTRIVFLGTRSSTSGTRSSMGSLDRVAWLLGRVSQRSEGLFGFWSRGTRSSMLGTRSSSLNSIE